MKFRLSFCALLLVVTQMGASAFPDVSSVPSFPTYYGVNPENRDDSQRLLNQETLGSIGNWFFSKSGTMLHPEWGQLQNGFILLNADSEGQSELKLSIVARLDTLISGRFTCGFYAGILGNQSGDGFFGYRINGSETIVAFIGDINQVLSPQVDIALSEGDVLEIFARSTGGKVSMAVENIYVREVDAVIDRKSLTMSVAYTNAFGTAYNVKIPSALRNNRYVLESSMDFSGWSVVDSTYIIQLENEVSGFTFTSPQTLTAPVFYRVRLDNPVTAP